MFSGRPHGYGYVQNTHEKRARSDAHNYTIVGTVNTHLPPTINTMLTLKGYVFHLPVALYIQYETLYNK